MADGIIEGGSNRISAEEALALHAGPAGET